LGERPLRAAFFLLQTAYATFTISTGYITVVATRNRKINKGRYLSNMRKLSFLFIAVVMLSLCAFSQEKAEVYGGYSLFRLDANAAPADRSLNGWDGEIGGKIMPFLSIIGNVGSSITRRTCLAAT